MVKVETEAPALWRKPPETANPSTLDKRASPRLYKRIRSFGTVTKSAILVRIGRVDLLPPDRSLRCARKLRTAPHCRSPEPKGLGGSSTMESTFFLEAGSTAIATAQSEKS